MQFTLLTPGELSDGEVALRLIGTHPADAVKGYVPYYMFAIVGAETGEKFGLISLRVGDAEQLYLAGHIGYSIYPEHRGHRYAAKACRLIFAFARQHGMESLLITCNPDNLPSRRTCEILGGKLLAIADIPEDNEMYWEGERQKCVFEMDSGAAKCL